jgi:hypothetical protein
MKIILGICLLSVILVFPVAIQRIYQKGWAHVMRFDYKCWFKIFIVIICCLYSTLTLIFLYFDLKNNNNKYNFFGKYKFKKDHLVFFIVLLY